MSEQRLTLTVHVEKRGDTLRVSYYDARTRPLHETTDTDVWARIDEDYVFTDERGEKRGMAALTADLDAGLRHRLLEQFTQNNLVQVGHTMFRVLMGNSERWEPVLRRLFNDYSSVRPNPPRHGVRVRIYTTINELVDLPWRLTAWKGKFLTDSGWTFEVVSELEPGPDVELETPCPLLVIAPQFRGMAPLRTDEHIAALRDALPEAYRKPTMLRVVQTRDDAREAFRGMSPRVVYYFGHGEIRGGQACLLMGDPSGGPDVINANDLKLLASERYPLMAYVNACKSGAAGWQSVGYQLTPEVKVVIANSTTAWSAQSGVVAIGWLTACLADARDPVEAAHEIDERASTRGFEWGMRTIHADYRVWRAKPMLHPGPLAPIGLRLNRARLRERALDCVFTLVRSDDQRVLSLVSYAAVGGRIDLSGRQIQDHLEDHASHLAQITWREVRFPPERDDLRRDLLRDLSISLGARPGEPIEHALRRCARRVDVGSAMPLLWLTWGVFGRHHEQALTGEDLQVWVRFCSELAQRCPPDIRVVGAIAFETDTAPRPGLEELVEKLAFRYIQDDDSFECVMIPPLPGATLLDIGKFLRDRANSRCPPGLVQEAAQLIYRRTRGHYARTIALIERAEREQWYNVVDELRGELRPEPELRDQPIL